MEPDLEHVVCPVCGNKVGAWRILNGTEYILPGAFVWGNGPAYPRAHGGCPGEEQPVLPALVRRATTSASSL